MANENNNIKELVSDDDDPTAELEIPTFSQHAVDESGEPRESDSHTHGLGGGENDTAASGQSIPELQSDLESRAKTIGRLQYDIQQLRAKWLGLETEISAREEIVSNLLEEAEKLKKKIARKDSLLKKRNTSIKDLKSELRQRDKDLAALEAELADQRSADEKYSAAREEAERELDDLRSKLEIVGTENVTVEQENKQLDEKNRLLQQQLEEQESVNAAQLASLEEVNAELDYLRSELERATREEHTLNAEINERDELQTVLELRTTELSEQLAAQRASESQAVAALEAARMEVELLNKELEAARNQSAAEIVQTQEVTSSTVRELQAQRAKTEEYADTLRHKFEDLSASMTDISMERDSLKDLVAELTDRNNVQAEELARALEASSELKASLETLSERQERELDAVRKEHEQELRTLRFELGEAKDTVTQAHDMNSQLASDLVDSRNFKEELERMLLVNEEEAQQRIAELEKKVKSLSSQAEEFEQKLDTKNTAINVLLGELSKKSEQIDSISEIEDVILEIDSRMSERFEEPSEQASQQRPVLPIGGDKDRITRVLVGSVGDQELRFPLFKDRLTIGRTAENDIQLKTAYISRRHAVVVTEGDATRVIDWGSKNGVYVNSEKVKERVLSNGDVLSVGNAKFRYEERPKRDT